MSLQQAPWSSVPYRWLNDAICLDMVLVIKLRVSNLVWIGIKLHKTYDPSCKLKSYWFQFFKDKAEYKTGIFVTPCKNLKISDGTSIAAVNVNIYRSSQGEAYGLTLFGGSSVNFLLFIASLSSLFCDILREYINYLKNN